MTSQAVCGDEVRSVYDCCGSLVFTFFHFRSQHTHSFVLIAPLLENLSMMAHCHLQDQWRHSCLLSLWCHKTNLGCLSCYVNTYHTPQEVDDDEEDGEHEETTRLPMTVRHSRVFDRTWRTQPRADYCEWREEEEAEEVADEIATVRRAMGSEQPLK